LSDVYRRKRHLHTLDGISSECVNLCDIAIQDLTMGAGSQILIQGGAATNGNTIFTHKLFSLIIFNIQGRCMGSVCGLFCNRLYDIADIVLKHYFFIYMLAFNPFYRFPAAVDPVIH
jgi:hypothetical protein